MHALMASVSILLRAFAEEFALRVSPKLCIVPHLEEDVERSITWVAGPGNGTRERKIAPSRRYVRSSANPGIRGWKLVVLVAIAVQEVETLRGDGRPSRRLSK
jgi:hypothetical protein